MANYIPTSCTDAYIKINNTHSLPAKCGYLIAPGSKVVWLETSVFLHFERLSVLKKKEMGGRNPKAKLTS